MSVSLSTPFAALCSIDYSDSLSHSSNPYPRELFFTELGENWQVNFLLEEEVVVLVELQVEEQLAYPWRDWRRG